jgi:hypothetical protein
MCEPLKESQEDQHINKPYKFKNFPYTVKETMTRQKLRLLKVKEKLPAKDLRTNIGLWILLAWSWYWVHG